jgi:hypothetical protein
MHQESARDGYRPYIISDLPSCREPHPFEKMTKSHQRVRDQRKMLCMQRTCQKSHLLFRGDQRVTVIFEWCMMLQRPS